MPAHAKRSRRTIKPDADLLTTAEAAAVLEVSPTTVTNLRLRGLLTPANKPNLALSRPAVWWFRRADVEHIRLHGIPRKAS